MKRTIIISCIMFFAAAFSQLGAFFDPFNGNYLNPFWETDYSGFEMSGPPNPDETGLTLGTGPDSHSGSLSLGYGTKVVHDYGKVVEGEVSVLFYDDMHPMGSMWTPGITLRLISKECG